MNAASGGRKANHSFKQFKHVVGRVCDLVVNGGGES